MVNCCKLKASKSRKNKNHDNSDGSELDSGSRKKSERSKNRRIGKRGRSDFEDEDQERRKVRNEREGERMTGHHTRRKKVVCEVVNLMNICLHVWFWWHGLDQMKKTPCGTYLMMYVVKTGMFGWARKVMMAMSLFVLACTVYWVSVEFSRPWTFWKMRSARLMFSESVRRWEELQNTMDNVKADNNQEEDEKEGDVVDDSLSEHRVSHDGCSRYSCPRCSPTKSVFTLSQEVTLVQTRSEPPAQMTGESKRFSQISVQDTVPHSRPASPEYSHPQIISPKSDDDFQILREVYESELFIQHCISASPYQRSPDGKPLTFLVIARSILFPKRYRSMQEGRPNPPSWFQCQLQTWKAIPRLRFPPQALVIYSHLRQSRLLDPLNGPFQTHAAMTYTHGSSGNKLPSWPSVSLASSLLLTAPSTPKKVWLGWYYAVLDLLIHIIVILQLELTLHWNGVRGLLSLWTSVGQLIPFIIGVGGLGLVLIKWMLKCWGKREKVKGRRSGWENETPLKILEADDHERSETFGLDHDVIEGYARWKEAAHLDTKYGAPGK